MAIEKYLAGASLGLFIMFDAEIITLFSYIIQPEIEIEVAPKIFMFISIGVAPAVILVGTSFFMVQRYGSRQVGAMIFAGGAALLIGMLYANSIIPSINEDFRVFAITITPLLFMLVSIPVMVVGAVLLKTKKRRRPKGWFPEHSEVKKIHVSFYKKSFPCMTGFHDLCPVKTCECTCHYHM